MDELVPVEVSVHALLSLPQRTTESPYTSPLASVPVESLTMRSGWAGTALGSMRTPFTSGEHAPAIAMPISETDAARVRITVPGVGIE